MQFRNTRADYVTDYTLHGNPHCKETFENIKSHFIVIILQNHLPDQYQVWLDLANNLTHLIQSRKLRDLVHKVRIDKAFLMQLRSKTIHVNVKPTVSFVNSRWSSLLMKTDNVIIIQMPVLSPNLLSNHRELRLAHLALGFISMGYVWQEGQQSPAQVKH